MNSPDPIAQAILPPRTGGAVNTLCHVVTPYVPAALWGMVACVSPV